MSILSRRVRVTCGLGLVVCVSAIPAPALASDSHDPVGDAAGPLDIERAEVEQSGPSLELRIQTAGAWAVDGLSPSPDASAGSQKYACLALDEEGEARLLCLAPGDDGKPELVSTRFGAEGPQGTPEVVGKAVKKQDNAFHARFSLQHLDLHPGTLRWTAVTAWNEAPCDGPSGEPGQPPPPSPEPPPALPLPFSAGSDRSSGKQAQGGSPPCFDQTPDGEPATEQLKRPRLVGCKLGGRPVVDQGPSAGNRVALTFDDGPSAYSSQVLDILEHNDVEATFFVVGQEISGRQAILRRMLRQGSMIGNHTLHHDVLASRSNLASASSQIKQAAGFDPCLFRPPEGVINSGLAHSASSLGMTSVLWDVDTSDYQLPGSGTIYQRVVSGAQAGSIVLMHDGGGPRSQTVAALPQIIETLKDRGFRLVTVAELLGAKMIWRPK